VCAILLGAVSILASSVHPNEREHTMSTLADIRKLYRLTATRFDRAYVGTAAPGEWRHVFGDDLADYAPTGPAFRTKAEALAALPAAVSSYYGPAVAGQLDTEPRYTLTMHQHGLPSVGPVAGTLADVKRITESGWSVTLDGPWDESVPRPVKYRTMVDGLTLETSLPLGDILTAVARGTAVTILPADGAADDYLRFLVAARDALAKL
jgi:hypothetical protein